MKYRVVTSHANQGRQHFEFTDFQAMLDWLPNLKGREILAVGRIVERFVMLTPEESKRFWAGLDAARQDTK